MRGGGLYCARAGKALLKIPADLATCVRRIYPKHIRWHGRQGRKVATAALGVGMDRKRVSEHCCVLGL